MSLPTSSEELAALAARARAWLGASSFDAMTPAEQGRAMDSLWADEQASLRKFTAGRDAFDAWTIAHVGAGAALGALRIGPVASLVALVLFEVAEAGLRATGTGAGLFAPESPRNIGVDLAAGAVGWLAVKAVRR